jgi:hypothetical protein
MVKGLKVSQGATLAVHRVEPQKHKGTKEQEGKKAKATRQRQRHKGIRFM